MVPANPPRPSFAERARSLVETETTGALSTLSTEMGGWPFGSFTAFGLDARNRPIILVSRLAEHSRNLDFDARASLLVTESERPDALGPGRVTLLVRFERASEQERAEVSVSYLARVPTAASLLTLKDFSFWRGNVERVRFIAGFGKIGWIDAEDWAVARPDPLAPHRRAICEHVSQHHSDVLDLCARGVDDGVSDHSTTMTGVDRLGFDVGWTSGGLPRTLRVGFETEVASPDEVRKELVALAKRLRA